MAIPNTPTNFIAQQADGQAALTWDQMVSPLAATYLIQRSLDNITFVLLATITGSPLENFFIDSNVIDLNKNQINISGAGVLVIGQTYVITSLGTTTQAQWLALGVTGIAAVGVWFTAIVAGSGTGTGTVQDGVTVGTQYFYKVAAVNTDGPSSYTVAQGIIICLPGEECLGNIRLYAKQRANRVGSKFVTDPEWNRYITESRKALYDILIQKFGNDYYMATPYCFITTGVDQLYPLPNGRDQVSVLNKAGDNTPAKAFYKSMLVEVALNPNDPNSWVTLRKYMRIQQNLWNYPNVYTFRGVTNLRYRFTGDSIQLVPQTQQGQYVRLWYAPRPKAMLLDVDMVDGVSGWEQYIVCDAARKALAKEESPTNDIETEIAMLMKRIEEAAENRDIGEPETVSDSKMRNLAWSDDAGYGPGSGFY